MRDPAQSRVIAVPVCAPLPHGASWTGDTVLLTPELVPSALPETPGGFFSDADMRGSLLMTSKGKAHEHANKQGQFDPRKGQFVHG